VQFGVAERPDSGVVFQPNINVNHQHKILGVARILVSITATREVALSGSHHLSRQVVDQARASIDTKADRTFIQNAKRYFELADGSLRGRGFETCAL